MTAGFRFLMVCAVVGALLAAPLTVLANAGEEDWGLAMVSLAAPGTEKDKGGEQQNPTDKGNPQNDGNSGSVKTVRDNGQGGEPGNGQGANANHYPAGSTIVVSGQNAHVGLYTWEVSRLAPDAVSPYRSGSFEVKSDGGVSFDFSTEGYPEGVYKVEVFGPDGKKVKSDNFMIKGGPSTPDDPGGDDPDDPKDNPDDPSDQPGGDNPSGSSTTVVAQAPVPAVVAQATPAATPAPVVVASDLPKAGGPALAPVAILAGSLLAGLGVALRRLT